MLQFDNERLPILRNALEIKDIREGKISRLKAPSGSPKKTEVAFQLLPFFLVCSAWVLANGCKSLMSPNSGNHTANSKGVHREVESEGSWRETSGLTN